MDIKFIFLILGVIIILFSLIGTFGSLKNSEEDKSYTIESPQSNDDSEDEYADGTDWNILTYEQKEVFINKSLFNLRDQNFQINKGVDFFVDALDAFYDDSSGTTQKIEIREAMTNIAVASGAITTK